MEMFPYTSPSAVGLSDSLTEGIDKMAKEDIENGEIVCAAVQVVCQDKTVYKKCHGWADKEKEIPLNENHIFRMASMTKPITAVCVLKQMEAGKLDLDDPAGKFIPGLMNMEVAEHDAEGKFIGSHPSPRPLTVRDLLSHSSGLDSGPWSDGLNCDVNISANGVLRDMAEGCSKSRLGFDPGSMGSYSWLVGFDVLAHIVELTSDMPFADFADANIFRPLDMKDTCFVLTDEQWERAVTMYRISDDKKSEPLHMYDRMICTGPATYHSGAANVVSCLSDYSRFANMLCNDGISCGVRILQEDSVRQMRSRQAYFGRPGEDETLAWGLGVQVVLTDNGKLACRKAGTYGWSGAFGTHFWCDPARKLSVVYCTNMLGGAESDKVTRRHIEKAVFENM
ncbi:MAG: beta-lactamase family protein [Clostridia bacterium]|nr:beta-lactamase family protein [Clostridia bacterium]